MTKKRSSFSGKRVLNFKGVMIYPHSGNTRFHIQFDKNNSIVDLHYSIRETVDDGKKKSVKFTLGERPQKLFERIKGRPFVCAQPWIDDYLENYSEY